VLTGIYINTYWVLAELALIAAVMVAVLREYSKLQPDT
jgi:hypothetical protein